MKHTEKRSVRRRNCDHDGDDGGNDAQKSRAAVPKTDDDDDDDDDDNDEDEDEEEHKQRCE